uniref:hypothetical protein n=1 Tax=Novosphingobium malaysiense TaxID=1348853 RepID=UPI001E4313ED|nr:hypothetical protein [Novosphingobium malaysiense]
MKAGAGSYIEHGVLATRLEHVDEKAAFAFGALLPIDEFVPLLDKAADVFGYVFVRFPDGDGILPVVLRIFRCEDSLLLIVDRSSPRFSDVANNPSREIRAG